MSATIKLQRVRFVPGRYLDSSGRFRIQRKRRDWSLTGFGRGTSAQAHYNPLIYWEVTSAGRRASSAPVLHTARTLTDAREWIAAQ